MKVCDRLSFLLFLFITLFENVLQSSFDYHSCDSTNPRRSGKHRLLYRKVYCIKSSLPITCCSGPRSTREYLILPKGGSKRCIIPNCKKKCAALKKQMPCRRKRTKIVKLMDIRDMPARTHRAMHNYKQVRYQSDDDIFKQTDIQCLHSTAKNNILFGEHYRRYVGATERTSLTSEINLTEKSNKNAHDFLSVSRIKFQVNQDNADEITSTEFNIKKSRLKKNYDSDKQHNNNRSVKHFQDVLPKYVSEFLHLCKLIMELGGNSSTNNQETNQYIETSTMPVEQDDEIKFKQSSLQEKGGKSRSLKKDIDETGYFDISLNNVHEQPFVTDVSQEINASNLHVTKEYNKSLDSLPLLTTSIPVLIYPNLKLWIDPTKKKVNHIIQPNFFTRQRSNFYTEKSVNVKFSPFTSTVNPNIIESSDFLEAITPPLSSAFFSSQRNPSIVWDKMKSKNQTSILRPNSVTCESKISTCNLPITDLGLVLSDLNSDDKSIPDTSNITSISGTTSNKLWPEQFQIGELTSLAYITNTIKSIPSINRICTEIPNSPTNRRPTYVGLTHVGKEGKNNTISTWSSTIKPLLDESEEDESNATEIRAEEFYSVKSYNGRMPLEDYVEYLCQKSEAMYRKYRLAMWDYETNITHQTRKKSMVTSLEISQYQKNLNEALKPLKKLSVSEPSLDREIRLLYLPGMSMLPDFKITEFEQVLYAMNTIYSAATVNNWQNPTQRVAIQPVIAARMAKSRDPEELKYYWLEWRKATGKRLRSLFEQYVELINMTATRNGFSDAGEMWTRKYETEDFMQLLGSQWEDIRPFYVELHAYVRHGLHRTYGDVSNAKDSGTIPVHLTGDIWGEDWQNLYPLVTPYPGNTEFMDVNLYEKENKSPVLLPCMSCNVIVVMNAEKGNKYSVRKMVEEAEKMFHSLGFPRLSESFWSKSVLHKPNNTEMACEPSAWDMLDSSDYRIKLCGKSTMKDFFAIHEILTKVEYFIQFQNLSFPFRDIANPSFGDALAGAIVLSAKSRHHLEMLKLIPKPHKLFESNMNFLMRMALEKVALLPYSYILDLWRHKVFQGKITSSEYNKKWWELRSQYQGVSPPAQRDEEDFDIGSKFEVAANKPFIKYFLSTLMQFQIHEALCEQAGHKGDLFNCDITSSVKAGKTLRKVMSMGASQHWRVVLKQLTGERRIESSSLLRYFRPLFNWLRKKNIQDGQRTGWEIQI